MTPSYSPARHRPLSEMTHPFLYGALCRVAAGLGYVKVMPRCLAAFTRDVETFALRYLVWKAGEVRDTGWCRWVCGQFRGSGGPLDARDLAVSEPAQQGHGR